MILLIDNYDSFTFNLYQCIGSLDDSHEIVVRRNDEITLEEVHTLEVSHLIVSPGPGVPSDAGVSVSLIQHFARRIPVLGVCLGHQCIAEAFGGKVTSACRLMHGKTSLIHHDGLSIFDSLSNPFVATRYHSLSVGEANVPDEFVISAWTEDDREIMGIRHSELPVEGVQFHPESYLTEEGPKLISKFLEL